MEQKLDPYKPSALVSSLAARPSQQFKWYPIVISVAVFVFMEVLLVVTARIWLPVFHQHMTGYPWCLQSRWD